MHSRRAKGLLIGLLSFFGALLFAAAAALIISECRTAAVRDDYFSVYGSDKYSEPVLVEGVDVITQDVSCGYAVLEMFSSWSGHTVTEESLYKEYGKVVTSTGRSFCAEMNKRFPEYRTQMHRYLKNTELIDLVYENLSEGIPMPFEWAAQCGEKWTLHYSLITGMDIPHDRITVANPYGYLEALTVKEFLDRTRFDAFEKMPLLYKLGFAFGVFEKNTVFSVRKAGSAQQDPAESGSVRTVTIGNRQMDYLRFGKEDGEKFVILPGLALKSVMGSAEGIISAYSVLAEKYDVYLFDHIREEPDGYTIADMAEDTLKAFDRLGLEHAHLMGVSMGGMVAQTFALKAPERVLSLFLCSTAMNMKHSDPAVFGEWEALAERKNGPALMEAFGESVYTPSFYEQYKDYIIASGEGVTDLDYRNFLISLRAVRDFDMGDGIDSISCPVYVIGAGEDRVLGVHSSCELAEALHCAYYIYEGYGHGVYDEAPDYLTRISRYLDRDQTGN